MSPVRSVTAGVAGSLPMRAPEGGSAIKMLDGDKVEGPGFSEVLGRALTEAGGAERASEDAAVRFAAGDPAVGIHEVVIAAEKANISVRFAVTLKNRMLEAYRELMNTQV